MSTQSDPPDPETYALASSEVDRVAAPEIDYRPPVPKAYHPRMALIGAGGIAAAHLDAYRTAGFDVAAICNRSLAKAEARRDEFYPQALATDDYDALLNDDSLEVFDITPHPHQRVDLIEKALKAGKHVLSQKPFVTDLDMGERLVQLARDRGVKLAVNQNGRWAPHMAWMREAVRAGLIGELVSFHAAVHWDHSWIAGTPFDEIEDVILYDFAVHWFDFLASVAGDRMRSVVATMSSAPEQSAKPPLLAQALVQLDRGQASLVFDAATPFGPKDTTFIAGTKGSIASSGPDLGKQTVTLTTEAGTAVPELEGTWFNDGFRGTMGELLCAIEEDREPRNGAAENLKSLALTFAALRSAKYGVQLPIGDCRSIEVT